MDGAPDYQSSTITQKNGHDHSEGQPRTANGDRRSDDIRNVPPQINSDVIIAVSWSTQLSPGDVRAMRASQLARGGADTVFSQLAGRQGSRSAVRSVTGHSRPCTLTFRGLVSSFTARPTYSGIVAEHRTRKTRSATTSGRYPPLSSGPRSAHAGRLPPIGSRGGDCRRGECGAARARNGEYARASNALFATYLSRRRSRVRAPSLPPVTARKNFIEIALVNLVIRVCSNSTDRRIPTFALV
jgi:hypothetical protein